MHPEVARRLAFDGLADGEGGKGLSPEEVNAAHSVEAYGRRVKPPIWRRVVVPERLTPCGLLDSWRSGSPISAA